MNKKLLAGVAAVGLMAGGGSATAMAAAAAPAAASTVAGASSTSKAPGCGPLEPLVAKGTITRAQAMAIHDAFVKYVRDHWRHTLDTVLSQEVKNHIISAAQARAVTNAITEWIHNYRGEGAGHHGPCHHYHSQDMNGESG